MDYPFTRQAPVNTGANLVLLGFPRTEIIQSAELRIVLKIETDPRACLVTQLAANL
jgi:hypothetical protein